MKKAIIIFSGIFLASAILTLSHFAKSTSIDAISQTTSDNTTEDNVLITIKTTYSSDIDLNIYSLTGQYIWARNCWNPTLCGLKDWNGYDVELSGKVDDETMYVVFRLHDDTIGDYYEYVFFSDVHNYGPNGSYENEDECWHMAGRVIRIAKRLSADDFKNIKVGSSFAEVAEIDPVCKPADPYDNDKCFVIPNDFEFDTLHYTDEGLIHISYSRKTVDDEFTVGKIELDPAFTVNVFDEDKGGYLNYSLYTLPCTLTANSRL